MDRLTSINDYTSENENHIRPPFNFDDNDTNIKYPFQIDIEKYVMGYKKKTKYELYAEVCHLGGVGSGHYFAIAKS